MESNAMARAHRRGSFERPAAADLRRWVGRSGLVETMQAEVTAQIDEAAQATEKF